MDIRRPFPPILIRSTSALNPPFFIALEQQRNILLIIQHLQTKQRQIFEKSLLKVLQQQQIQKKQQYAFEPEGSRAPKLFSGNYRGSKDSRCVKVLTSSQINAHFFQDIKETKTKERLVITLSVTEV